MVYRATFYLLILTVGFLGTVGTGLWNSGASKADSRPSAVVAAPLAGTDNSDSEDNSGEDNGSEDNSSEDNGSEDNSGEDNGSEDNSGDEDNCEEEDNGSEDNGSEDNGDSEDNEDSEDNSDNESSWNPFGGFASILAKGSSCPSDDNGDNGVVTVSNVPTPAPTATPRPVTASTPQPVTQPLPPAPLPEPCIFTLGFANLRAEIIRFEGQDVMGVCRENEHGNVNAATGQLIDLNTLQLTANGLNVWDQPTNTMRFTNGAFTWTYSKCLLQKRANTEVFAWERNPSLLQYPGEAPPPPGSCGLV